MRASARNPWLVFAVVFASGVVMMMGQYKVAPLMGTLVDYFDVDAAVGGWLMSAFSFAGIALGIPAAIILGKAGARRAGTIAIGCSAVGNVAGMLATEETIAVLIVARVLEGVGVAVLGVVAPAVIARLFDERRQGLPLGIWSTWIAAGMLFSYPVAVPLADAFGTWKAVWCLCAVLSTLTEILYFCIVRPPEREACRNGREAQARRPFAAGRSFYALIAAYVFFSSAMAAFNTYAPAYLQYGLGASATAASLLSTFISAGALLGGLAAGAIVQKTQRPLWTMRAGLVAYGAIFLWAFGFPLEAAAPLLALVGFIKVFCPTSVYDAVPRFVGPSDVGMAMGIVSVAQNIGMTLGPPAIGTALGSLSSASWGSASGVLVALCALGLAFAAAARSPQRSDSRARQPDA